MADWRLRLASAATGGATGGATAATEAAEELSVLIQLLKLYIYESSHNTICVLKPVPLLKDRAASLTLFVSIRQHTSAYVSIRQHTLAYISIRQNTSEYVSIRQHTSAYVSIREDACVLAPVPLLKGRAASMTLLPGGAPISTCKSKPLLLKIARFSSTTISSGACVRASTKELSKALSKAVTLF